MKPVSSSRKVKKSAYNNEEHIVSIIVSLLKNCTGANKQRILNKFAENDFEKVDRLMELYFKYLEQVDRVELEIAREKVTRLRFSFFTFINDTLFQRLDETVDEDDDEKENEFYMRRLENGLFALQSVAYIILDISANAIPSVNKYQPEIFRCS